ncbi:hypothetical protein JCM10213_007771 [Rhodosporidiobolus nylandii]
MLFLRALKDTLEGVLAQLRQPSEAEPVLAFKEARLPVELLLEILEHLAQDIPDAKACNALKACCFTSTSLLDLALPLLLRILELDVRSIYPYGIPGPYKTHNKLASASAACRSCGSVGSRRRSNYSSRR